MLQLIGILILIYICTITPWWCWVILGAVVVVLIYVNVYKGVKEASEAARLSALRESDSLLRRTKEASEAARLSALRESAPLFRRECNLENTDIVNENGSRRQAILKKIRNKVERGNSSFYIRLDGWGHENTIRFDDYDPIGSLPLWIFQELKKFEYNQSTHSLRIEFVKVYEYVSDIGKTCLGCTVAVDSIQVDFP